MDWETGGKSESSDQEMPLLQHLRQSLLTSMESLGSDMRVKPAARAAVPMN